MTRPSPPRLFMPMAAMSRLANWGRTRVWKLRKAASNPFNGSLQASNAKSKDSMRRWIAGSLWPVKPTYRTLPLRLGTLERLDDAALCEVPIGGVLVHVLVYLP